MQFSPSAVPVVVAAPTQSLLSFFVPGRLLLPAIPQNEVFSQFCCDVDSANSVNEIGVVLHSPLPDGFGAAVYFAPHSALGAWQYLGFVANHTPSQLFRTCWNRLDLPIGTAVRIGVSLMPLLEVQALPVPDPVTESTRQFGRAVAMDLYKFISSHSTTLGNGWTELIDKWYKKLEEKQRIDPLFWKQHLESSY